MTSTDGTLKYSNKSLAYDALSSSRRRKVIRALDEADSSLTLHDLAQAVGRKERESEEDIVESEQIKRIQASLYHVHVPKLADAGIVRYQEESDRVRLTQAITLDAIDVLGE